MLGSWTGKRLSVLLVAVVGVLSILTGIANIAVGSVVVIAPLQPYVPATVRTIAGFTGTITGFLMVLSALGLRRGFRVAWLLALLLLPVTAAQGLIQSSSLSLPLIVSSLLSIPTLALSRRHFRTRLTLSSTQLAAGLSLAGVVLYGTVGTYALSEEFAGVRTVLDAFYFTIVTASTVGYGDVTPTTQVARLFALTVLAFGTAAFAITLGSLLGPILESRFAAALGRVRDREFDLLEEHVLVLGHGELTDPIVSELAERDRAYAVVTADVDYAAELSDRDVLAVHADPTEESVLERARIGEAAVAIVATPSDSRDAFSILTARQLAPDIRIVAAASNAENVPKLERAGADVVVSPFTIGGKLLAGAVTDRGGGPPGAD